MAERISNWEQALSDYLMSKRKDVFAYGSFDCAHFVAGAIEAMTGENAMEGIREYNSEISSLRVLKELGFDGVEQFADSKFVSIPVGFAQTGDMVLHDGSLGIVFGSKAVFATEVGYTFVDRSEWVKSWEVGRG